MPNGVVQDAIRLQAGHGQTIPGATLRVAQDNDFTIVEYLQINKSIVVGSTQIERQRQFAKGAEGCVKHAGWGQLRQDEILPPNPKGCW